MTQFRNDQLMTEVLSEFAHTLANRYEVSEVLYRLAEHIVEILGAVGTGVALTDSDGRLHPVTGINELSLGLETLEERFQEGPCVDAYLLGKVVRVSDLSKPPEQWPRWNKEARERNVRAVLGVPLRVRDESLGAVNIYSAEPREWHDTDVKVACILADMAASYVANASALEESRRTTEQLREALESRIIIEQAKGVLANELRCTVDQAFVVLREHARRNGASLRQVAHAVVHLGLRPPRRGGER